MRDQTTTVDITPVEGSDGQRVRVRMFSERNPEELGRSASGSDPPAAPRKKGTPRLGEIFLEPCPIGPSFLGLVGREWLREIFAISSDFFAEHEEIGPFHGAYR